MAASLGRTLNTGRADYEPPGCWIYTGSGNLANSIWYRAPGEPCRSSGCACSSSRNCVLLPATREEHALDLHETGELPATSEERALDLHETGELADEPTDEPTDELTDTDEN